MEYSLHSEGEESVKQLNAHLFLMAFKGAKSVQSNKECRETVSVIHVFHGGGLRKQGLQNKVVTQPPRV